MWDAEVVVPHNSVLSLVVGAICESPEGSIGGRQIKTAKATLLSRGLPEQVDPTSQKFITEGKIMEKQKIVAAIHDISCLGKCSLTVALPVLSAAGIETAAIPTAVLSTHTGGFKGYTSLDLTAEIPKIIDHWKSLGLKFDAIYSGYLGSIEQVDIVCDFLDSFKGENTLAVVDPAMADNGKMYALLNMEFAAEMKKLCSKADIIVPNLTEACFLLGEEYIPFGYDIDYISSMMHKLSDLGPKKIVLTGVHLDSETVCSVAFDRDRGRIHHVFRDKISGMFHGTGDVFASALTAALMNGKDLFDSTEIAVDFTVDSIKRTVESGAEPYGVDFERGLGDLIKAIK